MHSYADLFCFVELFQPSVSLLSIYRPHFGQFQTEDWKSRWIWKKRKTLLEKGYTVLQQLTQLEVSPIRNWISSKSNYTAIEIHRILLSLKFFAFYFYILSFRNPIFLNFYPFFIQNISSNPIRHLINHSIIAIIFNHSIIVIHIYNHS